MPARNVPPADSPWARLGLSRNAVDRAGKTLKAWHQNGTLLGPEEQAAMQTVAQFRAQHQGPLISAVMGLRSAVKTSGYEVVVAQRLKRQPRIIGKLARTTHMDLSRMQDIGGCRAILPAMPAVYRVLERVQRQKAEFHGLDDYAANPKSSGYRAVHLVVKRDGTFVEIQLRTPWQQGWADLVEGLDGSYGLNLKDEQGPEAVLTFLRLYGDAIHTRWTTGHLSPDTADALVAARENAAVALERVASGQ